MAPRLREARTEEESPGGNPVPTGTGVRGTRWGGTPPTGIGMGAPGGRGWPGGGAPRGVGKVGTVREGGLSQPVLVLSRLFGEVRGGGGKGGGGKGGSNLLFRGVGEGLLLWDLFLSSRKDV